MDEKERAAEAAPGKHCKDTDFRGDTQRSSKKKPLKLGEALRLAANVDICKRSGEVSFMAIIERYRKGGK